jgi:hypothetical protein
MEGAWGWDWTQLLLMWGNSGDPGPLNFSELNVDTYMALSLSEQDFYATQSVYDLSRMDALAEAAGDMASALASIDNDAFNTLCEGLDWYGCDGAWCEDYVDLTQLATLAKTVDPDQSAAYDAVIARVAEVVVYEQHSEGHPDARGMNVYYPCYYYPYEEYSQTSWAKTTGWDLMINAH